MDESTSSSGQSNETFEDSILENGFERLKRESRKVKFQLPPHVRLFKTEVESEEVIFNQNCQPVQNTWTPLNDKENLATNKLPPNKSLDMNEEFPTWHPRSPSRYTTSSGHQNFRPWIANKENACQLLNSRP